MACEPINRDASQILVLDQYRPGIVHESEVRFRGQTGRCLLTSRLPVLTLSGHLAADALSTNSRLIRSLGLSFRGDAPSMLRRDCSMAD